MAQTRVDSRARGFRLERALGEGSTATAWLAVDEVDSARVVLKVANSREAAAPLAREALYASLALSPRLPEMLRSGLVLVEDDHAAAIDPQAPGARRARPFVAFRDRPGRPLVERFDDEPSARHGLALRVACEVGEALADLHDLGLCHGDVKPDNILWQPDAGARLIDLGLAGPADLHHPEGATPRYLALGDRELGDGRARDLLALGLVIGELVTAELRNSDELLPRARELALPPALAPLVQALLSREPGARPSARWLSERARLALRDDGQDPPQSGWQRSVRASYLKLRGNEVGRAAAAAAGTAPWLAEALAVSEQLRALCAASGASLPASIAPSGEGELGPLDPEQRVRWLVSLVGSAAASWPSQQLADTGEAELALALSRLAGDKRPQSWTLGDVEAALTDQPITPTPATTSATLDVHAAAELGLRLARIPIDDAAIRQVEALADSAPEAMRVAAADALRLAGQLGRARALVGNETHAGGVVADILRRSGDLDAAVALAERAIEEQRDHDDRARACVARILLDRGERDDAARLLTDRRSAACAEVSAYLQLARGRPERAVAEAQRGQALATRHEDRARLAGALAYVSKHAGDARGARHGYRLAVEHALRAGAVLEEASYRTGEASACVDLGELEAAIETARRAALLWDEVLNRPAMAARAWLARAAAYADLDASHEATHAAEQAIARARSGQDDRARAYALGSIADAHPATAPAAAEAAKQAAALVGEGEDEDQVFAAARLWRHVPGELDARRRAALDRACARGSRLLPLPRLLWWTARAERRVAERFEADDAEARAVLSELCALAESDAPPGALGKAMYAASRLAAALSDTEALARVEVARQGAAQRVLAGCGSSLATAAGACAWLSQRGHAQVPTLGGAQAVDLGRLVRALSERKSLRTLLDRVVDVLLLWTGAERGLLLLKGPDGELTPRSARNLSRDDLHEEQLAVSTSLALQAIERAEPVLAIDAMEELSTSYDSVHALKLRSVLVLPLITQGEVLGVVYLDDRIRRGAFGERELSWAQAVAPVAALAIDDARARKRLERAVRKAERASRELEDTLARKETALDVAERELAKAVSGKPTRFRYENIIGESEALQKLLGMVDRVAPSDIPVLLLGESGSGKELIARALHRGSPRASHPFVGENCGALPETLLESTLFGHVRGAFTGAHRPRVGLFEAADGGTLFLDEIGEMSLGMQTKLLRVLEDSLVRPVGSTRAKKVDVRIIGATHRDLEQMVADGSFREDLYYRLNVISIVIPPLRERASDIPLLVEHLIAKHAAGRAVKVSRAAGQRLMRFDWPGNVRQLENEVRRALLLTDTRIDVEHLSIPDTPTQTEGELGLDVRARIDRLEVDLVEQALERTGGNQTQAAKLLGVSRYGLHKMIKRLGIENPK